MPPGLACAASASVRANDGCVHVACLRPRDHFRVQIRENRRLPRAAGHAENASRLSAWTTSTAKAPVRSIRAAARAPSFEENATNCKLQDVVAIGDEMLHAAVRAKASDIHLDPNPSRGTSAPSRRFARNLPPAANERRGHTRQPVQGLRAGHRRETQPAGRPVQTPLLTHRDRGSTIRVATLPTKTANAPRCRCSRFKRRSRSNARHGPREPLRIRTRFDLRHGMILLTGTTGSGRTPRSTPRSASSLHAKR